MSLEQFKCLMCKVIPTESVFSCSQKHLICAGCSQENNFLCTCLENLTLCKENPLLVALSQYSSKTMGRCSYPGCSFECIQGEVASHMPECRFRPYKCIGCSLGLWSCNWIGQQKDIVDHLKNDHRDLGERFCEFQASSIPFLEYTTYGTLNLIQAHEKNFVFYFFADQDARQIHFAVLLLGKRKTAKRFLYDLIIKSPAEAQRRIKFTERCISDSDALSAATILELPQIITVTHDAVKSHVKGDNIHFTIRLTETPVKVDPPKVDPPKTKKEPPKLVMPKKAGKRPNVKKNSSSIPSPENTGPPKIKIEEPPKLTLPLNSSINKTPTANEIPKEPPCLTPSINKAENENVFQFPKKDPVFQKPIEECQQYKDSRSSRYIQQIYPTSCLSKPTLKK